MLAAAAVMAAVIYAVKPFLAFLSGGRLMPIIYLGIVAGLGVMVYGLGIFLLKVKGLEEVRRFLKERRSHRA